MIGVAFSPDGHRLAIGQQRRHGAAVERRHRPTHRRPPHRPHRRGAGCGVQPRRAPAGQRRHGRDGAAVGRRHRPTDRRPADRPHRLRCAGWRSARTGTGWPPPATTARCGCGTPTPANPIGDPLTGHTGDGERCGVQPRRAPTGHRQRRRHGAAVGRRHRQTRSAPRSPATPARCAVWRSAPTGTGWPPAATTARCGCGTPTPANPSATPSPATPARWTVWRSAPTGTGWPPASWDNTVRLWNTDTGQPIGDPLTGHTGAVCSVAFSPDGHRLASGQRRRHGAAVERRHRPTHRRPAHRPHRPGEQCGVQPRRAPAGHRPATTPRCGCGTPTPANRSAPRSPATPTR